jgi:hypothetical protein
MILERLGREEEGETNSGLDLSIGTAISLIFLTAYKSQDPSNEPHQLLPSSPNASLCTR